MRPSHEELEELNRRAADRPKQLFLLTVLVGLACLLAKPLFYDEERASAVNAEQAVAIEQIGGGDEPRVTFEIPSDTASPQTPVSVPPYSPPRSSGRSSYVQVYQCTVNGQRVFSDQPCAEDAQARVLQVQQADPYEVARMQQSQQQRAGSSYGSAPLASSSRPQRSSSALPSSNAAACESVDRAIENLNARMRQPYTSAEGERLRERWHQLKRQRYDLGCGR